MSSSINRSSVVYSTSHNRYRFLKMFVVDGALVNESYLPRATHYSIVASAAFHQAQHSHHQEGEDSDSGQESMSIHLLLRFRIRVLKILHPVLRHLRNIEKCRCIVLYQIYRVFIISSDNLGSTCVFEAIRYSNKFLTARVICVLAFTPWAIKERSYSENLPLRRRTCLLSIKSTKSDTEIS